MTERKSAALGISFGSARARLDRDLLFYLAVKSGYKCLRCGEELRREDFSVDHIVPWLNSEDPKKSFFDINNIGFSHMHCNLKELADRIRVYPDNRSRREAEKPRKAEWYAENKDWWNPSRYRRRNKTTVD